MSCFILLFVDVTSQLNSLWLILVFKLHFCPSNCQWWTHYLDAFAILYLFADQLTHILGWTKIVVSVLVIGGWMKSLALNTDVSWPAIMTSDFCFAFYLEFWEFIYCLYHIVICGRTVFLCLLLLPSHFDSPVFFFHLSQIITHFPIEKYNYILIFLKYPHSM